MILKDIEFGRAENLSTEMREKFNLPERGLIAIETFSHNLRIEMKEITSFRNYLLSFGEFREVNV